MRHPHHRDGNHDGRQRSGRGCMLAERFNPSRQNALVCRDGCAFLVRSRSIYGRIEATVSSDHLLR